MIPDEAVEAAARAFYGTALDDVSDEDLAFAKEGARLALEAAAPHILAAKVADAKANNDHIVEGGDGYSAGFHYALQCISQDV